MKPAKSLKQQARVAEKAAQKAADEFVAASGTLMAERLRERLGDVAVVLEPVAEIPRTANGKLRSVVCAIPTTEREALLAKLGTGRVSRAS